MAGSRAGAGAAVATLANRAVAVIAANDPFAVARFLEILHRTGAVSAFESLPERAMTGLAP